MSRDPEGKVPPLVAVGASAGGVEALTQFSRALDPDLDAAVLVVLHVSTAGTSVLADILGRVSPLPVLTAEDGAEVLSGHLYVARPDHHMRVERGRLRLDQGPRENGVRPAVDPLFRSVATAAGPGAIGVILSGTRDDGVLGLHAIKAAGGTALVQSPEEALFEGMPRGAIDAVEVDHVLNVADIASTISRVVAAAKPSPAAQVGDPPPPTAGSGTRYTCPDCGGSLWSHTNGGVEQLRCTIGHSYGVESFAALQARAVEQALWTAYRTLDDRCAVLRDLASRARDRGHERSATAFQRQADETHERAELIRELVQGYPRLQDDEPAAQPA